ncbi:MAG: signal peptidase I [bacterium]|nr:signal peptidase I [bacterium]
MTDQPEELPQSFAPRERPTLRASSGTPESTPQPASEPVAAPTPEAPEVPARTRGGGCLRETALVILVALALSVVVKTFFVQSFFIPSESMQTTLMVDDRIVVNKLASSEGQLRHGDIVVFVDPGGWLAAPTNEPTGARKVLVDVLTFVGILPQHAGEHMIKRIIGMPGDTVSCCGEDGRLSVNGTPVTESYLDPGVLPSEVAFDVVVPEGSVWVMGDNRQNSRDSRAHLGMPGGGFVPIAAIEGRAAFIVFPFDRLSHIGGERPDFAGVPEP